MRTGWPLRCAQERQNGAESEYRTTELLLSTRNYVGSSSLKSPLNLDLSLEPDLLASAWIAVDARDSPLKRPDLGRFKATFRSIHV